MLVPRGGGVCGLYHTLQWEHGNHDSHGDPADVPQILEFIRALAVYEREPDAVTATEAGPAARRLWPQPLLFLPDRRTGRRSRRALPSTSSTTPPGWAGRGSTSRISSCIPEFRGLGIGKALLQRVAAIAVEKGCPRLQWEVLDWNTPAIDFYRGHGRGVPGRVAQCARERRGAAAAGRRGRDAGNKSEEAAQ